MIELPESISLAGQLNETVKGKTIASVQANAVPHKLAWYFGDPAGYGALLSGKIIGKARGVGGKVEIAAEDKRVLLAEGINIRYFAPDETFLTRHQLLITFTDSSALACSVQMYGGLWRLRKAHMTTNITGWPSACLRRFPICLICHIFWSWRRRTPAKAPKRFWRRSSVSRGLATACCRISCSMRTYTPRLKSIC